MYQMNKTNKICGWLDRQSAYLLFLQEHSCVSVFGPCWIHIHTHILFIQMWPRAKLFFLFAQKHMQSWAREKKKKNSHFEHLLWTVFAVCVLFGFVFVSESCLLNTVTTSETCTREGNILNTLPVTQMSLGGTRSRIAMGKRANSGPTKIYSLNEREECVHITQVNVFISMAIEFELN